MQRLNQTVDRLFAENTVENLAVKIGRGDEVWAELYRSNHGVLDRNTLFDMASVTKILSVTPLSLIALERGWIGLDDPVSRFFPCPEEKRKMTVFHLLTHTMGIGHKNLTAFAEATVAESILEIPSDLPIGTEVAYSCPGFILMGKILEKVYGLPLNEAFRLQVAAPLGMDSTGFLPEKGRAAVNANLREELRGVVNDYNCRHLGGVAGNAGIFSTVDDMTRYVKMLFSGGAPLISQKTFDLARRDHTPGLRQGRGLGFLYVDGRYGQTGGLFPDGSIGHCGHTGQSVFVCPENGFWMMILSDATKAVTLKYGKENYAEVMEMRRDLHAAVKADLEEA